MLALSSPLTSRVPQQCVTSEVTGSWNNDLKVHWLLGGHGGTWASAFPPGRERRGALKTQVYNNGEHERDMGPTFRKLEKQMDRSGNDDAPRKQL